MKVERIEESTQLFSWMVAHRAHDFIFRGQEKDWPMIPSIGRPSNQATNPEGGRKPHDELQERAALADFKRRCITLAHPSVTSELDWLALAQHHGMPTRLLDWTESILIAAHFAVKPAGVVLGPKGTENPDAAIYAIPRLALPNECEVQHPFNAGRVFVHVPPVFDGRIRGQKSVFTVHNKPTESFAPDNLIKLEISQAICYELKHVLLSHGIDNSVIYPDISGVAQDCGWKYKWREYKDG